MEHSNTVDMERIANLVKAAGYAAYVEQTGGGVMTIYAYRNGAVPTPTPTNDSMPDVMAGPGGFDRETDRLIGWLNDFYSGRTEVDASTMEWGDDEYNTDSVTFTASDTESTIACVIVRQLQAALAQYGPRAQQAA